MHRFTDVMDMLADFAGNIRCFVLRSIPSSRPIASSPSRRPRGGAGCASPSSDASISRIAVEPGGGFIGPGLASVVWQPSSPAPVEL